MKRNTFRRLCLPMILAMLLTTVSCAPLAQEYGGADSGDELIGYLATVMTAEEDEKVRERSEELIVSGGTLQFRQNAIPAEFDAETYEVTCEAFEGYELITIATEDRSRSDSDPHFTGGGTHVHVGQGTTMKGTLLYDVTGIVKDGTAVRFEREPTAADFGGKEFSSSGVMTEDGEITHWEAAVGEELLANLYAVYLTAEGECYLQRSSASMVLSGNADGGSSALSAKQEVTRTYNGKSKTESLGAEITFQPALPYELRRITQFDENHNVLSVTEITVGESPEELKWEENAAYMMAERSCMDENGTLRRTYDTITEDSTVYAFPLWDGARVAVFDGISLTGREAN